MTDSYNDDESEIERKTENAEELILVITDVPIMELDCF